MLASRFEVLPHVSGCVATVSASVELPDGTELTPVRASAGGFQCPYGHVVETAVMLLVASNGRAVRRLYLRKVQPSLFRAARAKSIFAVRQQQRGDIVQRLALLNGMTERSHDVLALSDEIGRAHV